MQDLYKRDYLNDQRYACQVLNDEINLKRSGPLLIKNKLSKKGVQNNIIHKLMEELYSEELQLKNCKELAEKKLVLLNNLDPLQKKKRLTRYLAQKGYTWDLIERVL